MLFTFGRTFKVEICRQLASLDKLISQEVKKKSASGRAKQDVNCVYNHLNHEIAKFLLKIP